MSHILRTSTEHKTASLALLLSELVQDFLSLALRSRTGFSLSCSAISSRIFSLLLSELVQDFLSLALLTRPGFYLLLSELVQYFFLSLSLALRTHLLKNRIVNGKSWKNLVNLSGIMYERDFYEIK